MIPSEKTLETIEALALTLAREGGRLATEGLAREITVHYKTESQRDGNMPRDPVSEIDHAVESLIRKRVGKHFPDHEIIGEEVEDRPRDIEKFVWVIDPVDGTTNFVNGYPLFCVSIGVLYDGEPIVAAIWCASTHKLQPGVYHTRRGNGLHFEGEPFDPVSAQNVRRKLSAAPGGNSIRTHHWDNRVTGSAAIELTFVAAGIFQSAWFAGLKIWDLAAGLLLVQESGRTVIHHREGQFEPFKRFEPPAQVENKQESSLRDWHGLIIVGTKEAATELQQQIASRRTWLHRMRRFFRF